MNVGQLRTILEHLPDDLPVTIRNAATATHIEVVRRDAGRADWPAKVQLEGTTIWYEPDPGVRLDGRFIRADELQATLRTAGVVLA